VRVLRIGLHIYEVVQLQKEDCVATVNSQVGRINRTWTSLCIIRSTAGRRRGASALQCVDLLAQIVDEWQ